MAKKPLFREDMTTKERFYSTLQTIAIVILFLAFLAGGYVWVYFNPSSDTRKQFEGESDYEYHQRIQAEDKEDYKDCGFRPAC
jgi:hypothetical protein